MSLPSQSSTFRTWWAEGRPLVSRWTHTADMDLTWVGHAANAYHHHTRWVRWSWWSYIWRAPERVSYRAPFKSSRDWRGLSPWEVRWCRLRGHADIIYYSSGMEPDTRCSRCLEDLG